MQKFCRVDSEALRRGRLLGQGNMSKIKIRYQNKTGGPIEGLRAFIEPVPYLIVQDSGVPNNLPPQGGHFQMIQLKVGQDGSEKSTENDLKTILIRSPSGCAVPPF